MARYTEEQLRHKLKAAGYALHKSRARRITIDDLGDYCVVDVDTNAVIVGPRFNATLDEVEDWARSMEILES
ncbi:MAG: hypothetical protein IKN81_10465 [Oscillospiraceae bacterium]|nr:hypothetical protein [Oscillospiraceae bacterium]